MTPNAQIARAVRRALALSALAAAAAQVHAQERTAPQDQPQDQDAAVAAVPTVTVTGTRIQRQDYEATSPVVTVSNELLQQAGTVQIDTVLNQLPQLVPSLTTTSNNPSASGGAGQALIDLRGLGTERTLVLLNGTRLMPTYTNGQIDVNQVPAALIENIEILTGGASSVYGSDAVGGVVNIRLREDFQGAELSTQFGRTEHGDGETLAVEFVLGGNFAEDRGNAVLALSYDDREEILSGNRSFGQVSLGPDLLPFGSATIPEGQYDISLTNPPSQEAVNRVFSRYGVASGTVTADTPLAFNANGTLFGTSPVANFQGSTADPGFNPNQFSYNFAPVNYLQLPLTRRQIAGFTNYEIGEWANVSSEAYARLTFTTYEAEQQLAATPITGLEVPVTNPNIPADLAEILASRADPTEPFTFRRRTLEAGERLATNNFDVLQGLVGIRGDLGFANREWNWDLFASWGRTETTESQLGNISFSRIQGLLEGEDLPGCPAASFNPFGAGNISPACAQAISIRATNVIEIEQENIVGSITGNLFELPAGPLQAALGAEYRNTRAEYRPDEFLSSGDVVGFNAQPAQQGRVGVNEYFAELAVPLLQGIPAVDELNLELGYRYSDYNVVGGVDTYKAALNWAPIEPLRLRASYNRAIRAPSILELFLPPQENFPGYSDPCNAPGGADDRSAQVLALCQAQGIPASALTTFEQPNPQVRTIESGSLTLDPETADTYTLGLVWQPEFEAFGLRTALDYWRYDIAEAIDQISAGSTIGRCFNEAGANPGFDPNNPWCQRFTRLPSGEITDVQQPYQNLGEVQAEGVDLQIDFSLPLGERWGRLNTNFLVTRLLDWRRQEDELSPFGDFEGTITTDIAEAFPQWKGTLNLEWQIAQFGFTWNARFIDSLTVVNDDALGSPVTEGLAARIPSFDYHRFTARWSPTDAFDLRLGVDNVFDEDPPIYTDDAQAGQQANTDPTVYDILGRRYFLVGALRF